MFGILIPSLRHLQCSETILQHNSMAPVDKAKTSWIGRILGRDTDDALYDEFEEMNLDEALDTMEGDDSSFEDDSEFALEDEKARAPARMSGAEDLQINLVDTGDAFVAQALVPGVAEDKIEIDLNREMLTITVGSNEHCVEKTGDYLYEEISFGSFSRSLLLPAEVEVEDAKAEVKDGVLTIAMPKIDKAAHKKLSVKKK